MTELQQPPPAPAAGASTGLPAAAAGKGECVAVAYLVNQYPKVSHSFVRREIAALERIGHRVLRVSVRPAPDDLVDAEDLAERDRTRVVLAGGAAELLSAVAAVAARAPLRLLGGLRMAWRLGRRSDRGRLRHLIYLAEACVCLRWFRGGGIGHVHAHFGTNSTAVAMLCRRLGGPSYSFTAHGPEEFDKPEFLALGEKIRRSAFAVAISDFGRSQMFRQLDYRDWSKVRVVHCGVDALFLAAEPVPVPASPRLVCVGRLCEQKGQPLLIEAAVRLLGEGVPLQLELIGDGPMRSQLEAQIDAAAAGGAIRILGWRSAAEVRESLERSRALVLPSFAEGLPVVIMEALAAGRPVISSAIAGIPELVRDGENGWLVPAGNVDELVAAMRSALAAPVEHLERLGRAGRSRVLERHDADREARKLHALIAAGS